MNALTFSRFGGPEVLEWREVPDPLPVTGQVLVRTRAIGLNFSDIYRRQGRYHIEGKPPWIAGYEAAGEVVSACSETQLKPGALVAFADSPFANAELVAVPFEKIIPLPREIDFGTAAAVLLQGLTAQYLVRDSHQIQAGQRVLVHAAAGGVGLLLVQLARALGGKVLGLVSSESKRTAALEAGAEAVALYSEDWVRRARELGVDVAYDSVGSTLNQSIESVRRGGHVVFYGMAGGDPSAVDPRVLMDTNKSLSGGDLWNVLTSREERIRRSQELFQLVRNGNLKVQIAARVPLSEGAKAHQMLENRSTIGKVLLIP